VATGPPDAGACQLTVTLVLEATVAATPAGCPGDARTAVVETVRTADSGADPAEFVATTVKS
jgi:hypothetical protein